MSLEQIYEKLLKAKRPYDFFGPAKTLDDLKKAYYQYAKQVHPDLFPDHQKYIAKEAFSLLSQLYDLGEKELQQGLYGVVDETEIYKHRTPLFELTIKGEHYSFYENVFEGEVAYLFKGMSEKDIFYLKVAIDPADNDLLTTEYEVLSQLRHPSFPYIEQKIRINDTEAILMREVKGIPMTELMEEYPRGVPSEHVMWMLERLLSATGYLHSNRVIHGNIKPENILINKDNHNVSLVGFSFCIPEANTEGARYKIVNEDYTAPEVSKTARVLPSSDVYSIGKIAIKLLGGDTSSGGMPIVVDPRVRNFIRKMVSPSLAERPNDAWELWSELISLRTEVFGSKRFQKLD